MAGSNQPPDVPVSLWIAMVNAGQKYNVPPLVLASIWRGESASSYPNPYVNSSGYGGLFGTKDWNGSTQEQANLAASVFHNALVVTHGDIYAANGIYATGKPTPGVYGHAGLPSGIVPGYGSGTNIVPVATSGTQPDSNMIAKLLAKFGNSPYDTSGKYASGPNGDGTYGPHHLSLATIKAVAAAVLGGQLTTTQADRIVGVKGAVTANQWGIFGNAAQAVAGTTEAIANVLGTIGTAAFWIRAAEVLGGGIMILLGLYLLAKQVGLSPPSIPQPLRNTADDLSTVGPSSNPSGARPTRTRVVNQYYLEEPASSRRKRAAARAAPSNEIPF